MSRLPQIGQKFVSLRSGFHYELVEVSRSSYHDVLLFDVSNDNGLTKGYMEWYLNKGESFSETCDFPLEVLS